MLPSESVQPAAQRNAVLDIAKGIGILLIAFWHSPLTAYLPTFHAAQQTFAVPLFFFLSGVTLRPQAKLRDLVVSKARSVLGPYFATLLIVFLILPWRPNLGTHRGVFRSAMHSTGELMPQGFAPLWFLPALFLALVVAWFFLAACETARVSRWGRWAGTALLMVGGATLVEPRNAMAWSIDLLLINTAWLLCGAAVLLFVAVFWVAEPRMDLNMRIYAPVLATTAACALGILMTLQVAAFLARQSALAKALSFTGSMSLFILCFHLWLGSGFGFALDKYGIGDAGPVRSAVVFGASVALSLLLGLVIRRIAILRWAYLPSGQRRVQAGVPPSPT